MKFVRWIVAVVFVVGILAAAVYVRLPNRLEALIASSIEDYAAGATGTAAEVDSVSLSLVQRRSKITGLTVDNPSGYEAEHVLEIDTINVRIDAGSLAGSTLVLDEITVAGARLNAEQAGRSSNLTAILDHIRGTEQPEPAPSDDRVAIRRFALDDARMIIVSGALDEPEEVMLDPIVLTDLGQPESGLTYGEATDRILDAILASARAALTARVGEAASDVVERELEDSLRERVRELSE
ncbi:MAG TPA: hypothetical protein VMR74_10115 [Gammaproteobacteria bacterium]|nr:hypothetical protein [Gammaproteobacteria bacterium]